VLASDVKIGSLTATDKGRSEGVLRFGSNVITRKAPPHSSLAHNTSTS
jgi:hypothetical protein